MKYNLRIILPPGASDIKAKIPFEIDGYSYDNHYSYLDIKGRIVLEFKKSNMHDFYHRFFYVSYKLQDSLFNPKALILIGIYFFILMLVILSKRISISFDDPNPKIEK